MVNIMKKFFHNFDEITEYYNFLVEKTKNREYVEITNEWLIDNYYLLVEHKNNILNQKSFLKHEIKIINEMYYFLKNIVVGKNYNISFAYLTSELKKYQKETNRFFSYKELSIIIPTLIFIYTERINVLCREEYQKIIEKDSVSKKLENHDYSSVEQLFPDGFDIHNNSYFIFELNHQLHRSGLNQNRIFKELNEYLTNNNVSLKELINEEYAKKLDNNILISNIFSDFKEFFEFSDEDFFEKVSNTEKLLLTDDVYKNMTIESKLLYRNRLVKLARKNHLDEYSYLERIFNPEEHVGFKLFKQTKNTVKVFFYIFFLVAVTTVCSFVLSNYFIKPRVIGFFVMWIPISQLIGQIMNELLIHFVPTRVIPKLDYSKGIPEESKTMVVIPTIVSNTKKIKEMFDILESFYLVNKSDNLYFTLLGDVKAGDQKVMDFDDEVAKYGEEYANELNKKYKKNLFYFIYRKRIWNKKENCYLGYERKRGALLQFNKLLLGEYVDEDKYYQVNMLHDNHLDIKYVITLDTDTKLVLNSALNLVGAMAHPINHPVLNKNNTKVISGYGIMQPRVSVDIEATNKSLYSQVFAGIGGFDTYSAVVPNVYQDSFGEGSFVGKGIYDLKVFNQVLDNTFPDNLILSHDLLEGNYLRCGYISDIELMDDFPSKFLTDITRHHRWARGDTQIIQWLLLKVPNFNKKKVKNPINLLGKYKILDNIIRMFLNPMLLLILLLAFTGNFWTSVFWVSFVVLEIAISILFFLRSKMARHSKGKKEIYYKKLYFGGKSLLLRSYIMFVTIPFYTKLYMDAFFRTLYRLFYSHKNLLNWITAEEVEKTVDGSLKNYFRNFIFNIVFSIIFIIIGIVTGNFLAFIISFAFFTGPFVLYFVSKDINHHQITLSSHQ